MNLNDNEYILGILFEICCSFLFSFAGYIKFASTAISYPPIEAKALAVHGKPKITTGSSALSLPNGSVHSLFSFLPHVSVSMARSIQEFRSSAPPKLTQTLPSKSIPMSDDKPRLIPSNPMNGVWSPNAKHHIKLPHVKGRPGIIAAPHVAMHPFHHMHAPSESLPKSVEKKWNPLPAPVPSISFHKHHHIRKRARSSAPLHSMPPRTSHHQGRNLPPSPLHPPILPPEGSRQKHHHHPPRDHGSSSPWVQPPFNPTIHGSPAPAPSPSPTSMFPFRQKTRPLLRPAISPSGSFSKDPKTPVPFHFHSLPPPPPNRDCASLVCSEPFTNSPPGSPCGCILPMQVALRLSIALYTFFPLVSELAAEIASGVFMKQSQVRIMGANAANEQLKTIVLVNLVPLGEKFDNTTAFLAYEKFWRKQLILNTSLFGKYDALYVHYPGLPPSPPVAPSNIAAVEGNRYPGHGNDGRMVHPLGVDVRKLHKRRDNGSVIAIIVLSSFLAVVLCVGSAWLFLSRSGNHTALPTPTQQGFISFTKQPAGASRSITYGSGFSSASLSFGSSITTFTGPARTFSANEIERATDSYSNSRILGEGGFGRVYNGILDDGTNVAAKVLKRDDLQGGREFLAEVEMLSRLHHRNLVKLIGICIEENMRCLVYELVPNGSVDSHLHGVDKETAPLDWGARMKIALGAARGLAYLHEDSSPHVIHRDFKSSNILLEHDFNPKVSDFGLARTAMDEGNMHISTRVMGTFGYVAPEYAMTGHLLVKSDVYSYGVVLLELLTGRKPVDMSQPLGQENLVAWARPLLTTRDGLEQIIDADLGPHISLDSVAKVAAIASMCVQLEVSHRPFMGEVVQALKLVCNECEESRETGSGSCMQGKFSMLDIDTRTSTGSGQLGETLQARYSDYVTSLNTDQALSASDIFSTSARYGQQTSGSLTRHSRSGPLRTGRGSRFWQRLRGLSRGSVSEHGFASRLWVGSQ
ncbi:hypothetical protein Scep_007786 [Stephania cephalantha]|uniref:Protein kinase domain-containing protein n=1 Tax=Stephania cephalantha TaxID=152367 RepID=A0AAP0KCH1_9MAGN